MKSTVFSVDENVVGLSKVLSTDTFSHRGGEKRQRRRERYTGDVCGRGEVKDGPHLRRNSGVVFVYNHGTKNMLEVLVLSFFQKRND